MQLCLLCCSLPTSKFSSPHPFASVTLVALSTYPSPSSAPSPSLAIYLSLSLTSFFLHVALLVIISLLRFAGCGRFAVLSCTVLVTWTFDCHAHAHAHTSSVNCLPVYSVSDHITHACMYSYKYLHSRLFSECVCVGTLKFCFSVRISLFCRN